MDDVSSGILGVLTAFGFVLLAVLAVMTVLVPVFVYRAQRYLFDIRHEIRTLNDTMVRLEETARLPMDRS